MATARMWCPLCDGARALTPSPCPACGDEGFIEAALSVGEPCTYGIGSDRYAGVLEAIFHKGREVWVRLNHGTLTKFTLRRDGRYRLKGAKHGSLLLGIAQEYRSPEF